MKKLTAREKRIANHAAIFTVRQIKCGCGFDGFKRSVLYSACVKAASSKKGAGKHG